MKITRSILQDGNFAPVAVNYLGNIPDTMSFHEKHGLRHPFSIYHVSLRAVTEGFTHVLEEYNNEIKDYSAGTDVKFFKKLLGGQRNLLYSLREHIDDCYSVFKTLVDPAHVKKKIVFADKYLQAAKFKELDKFNNSIESYKQDYLSPLVNSLKHQPCAFAGFLLSWSRSHPARLLFGRDGKRYGCRAFNSCSQGWELGLLIFEGPHIKPVQGILHFGTARCDEEWL